MADVPSPKEISGTIPFFFYDVIGRIFPGTIFLLGVFLYVRQDLLANWPAKAIDLFPTNASAGYTLAFILIFFGVAHFLGVLLGALSFILLEDYWCKEKRPLNFDGLKRFMGADNLDELSKQYENHFRHKLTEKSLNESSFLCAYYSWKIDSNLGIMTATNDAEALAGRSLALVSILFFLLALINPVRALAKCNFSLCGWSGIYWVVGMAFIVVGAFVNFDYARKKRVFIRYTIFLAINGAKNWKGGDGQNTLNPSSPTTT